MIALQTIGGSSVVPPHGRRNKDQKGNDAVVDQDDEDTENRTVGKSKAPKGGKMDAEHASCGVVTVQRSWRVESSSRSVLFLGDGGDAGSEEGILSAHAWHCEDDRELESHEHKV